jgi:ABC-2 type transport system ATP-binding protein
VVRPQTAFGEACRTQATEADARCAFPRYWRPLRGRPTSTRTVRQDHASMRSAASSSPTASEAGDATIRVRGVVKRFGEVRALDDVDLEAAGGTVLGLLGPNGAGKTTAVRVMTTLLKPDAGEIRVAGLDAIHEAAQLRERIGLAGQYAAIDENLTGAENLTMVGRLYGMPRVQAKRRAAELLARFELSDAGGRPARGYSGGMRRRLDLAAALVARPPVLFLDEPTTGLDPRSRLALWETIEGLVADGTTVLLTTQYLDEADRLADRIAVIDRGKVIADGTSDELKDRVGGERLEIHLSDRAQAGAVGAALAPMAAERPVTEDGVVKLAVRQRSGAIVEAVRRLDEAGVDVEDVGLRRPTLDDVFLRLTGHAAEERDGESDEEPVGDRAGGRARR